MNAEDIFDRIKKICDNQRLLANGTGKPSAFVISNEDMHYIFTIGAKAKYGCEYFMVGTFPKEAMKSVLLGLLGMLGTGHDNRIRVGEDGYWAFLDGSYDQVNIALKGTLAAVYGTHTPLKQAVVPDDNGTIPGEAGFQEQTFKQLLYPASKLFK